MFFSGYPQVRFSIYNFSSFSGTTPTGSPGGPAGMGDPLPYLSKHPLASTL